jgi:hypothetical protein
MGLAGLSGLICRAAEPSLVPERFAVTPGATLQLDLAEIDPGLGHEPGVPLTAPDRIGYAFLRLGEENTEIRRLESAETGIRVYVQMQRPGLAAVVVGLKPTIVEMGPEKFAANLRKLHLGGRIRDELIAKAGPRSLKVSWRCHVKVFVQVGLPAEMDREWKKMTGGDLDLIPGLNPAELRVGKVLPVQLLYKGAALAHVAVNFRTFDGAHQHVVYTDSAGHAEATLGVVGKWLIYGTSLQPLADVVDIDLAMETTTLTVEVR